ncbi:hypothetical protein H8356DRAFT_1435826 [Neocallimastix lanati (nom. inval.)]|jgi:uncharacterized protein YxjI|uniref:DUF567-domain-containing protein n=1 Tax=Neocallimastix californiae TaxID=1754190 RepID=A0A1Y2B446_9FUNG|nr:hypothetical protein H8356DRAFT_1435826 [Neocallimastix sp. JGI-2020a]ORY29603.1 hypothetical protein LY90DRAFT_705538 [Neocallimastix californiae]|eukprot:ORY29603.1 hypothetical protein LY90DRAFT_705538 [Neocallimastix californiae]
MASIKKPTKQIVAINQRFVHDKEITLILKEKILSFSNEDYIVQGIDGESYFKCKGKAFSIRDKKFIHELDNTPILNIQNKILSLKGQMTIFEGDDNSKVIGKITPDSLLVKKKFTVQFHNKSTGNIEYVDMHCDYFGSVCEIKYREGKEEILVCKITKKELEDKYALSSQDDYYIKIAPGVDSALMMAIALCFDDFKNDQNSK